MELPQLKVSTRFQVNNTNKSSKRSKKRELLINWEAERSENTLLMAKES